MKIKDIQGWIFQVLRWSNIYNSRLCNNKWDNAVNRVFVYQPRSIGYLASGRNAFDQKFRDASMLFEVHVGSEGSSMVATWFTALMSTWPTDLHAGRSEFFIQGFQAIPFFAFAALEFLWQKSEAAHGEKECADDYIYRINAWSVDNNFAINCFFVKKIKEYPSLLWTNHNYHNSC